MGPNMVHLMPTGHRWTPCWPHEPCFFMVASYEYNDFSIALIHLIQRCLVNFVEEKSHGSTDTFTKLPLACHSTRRQRSTYNLHFMITLFGFSFSYREPHASQQCYCFMKHVYPTWYCFATNRHLHYSPFCVQIWAAKPIFLSFSFCFAMAQHC